MRYRTIFLSDIHLGSRGCSAEDLLVFLKTHDAETIYLIGDIIDLWQMKHRLFWPQAHNDVVQKLLRKARKGTRIVYIPGNHDETLRAYAGQRFGGLVIAEESVHVTATNKRLWLVHGDRFDGITTYHRWLAIAGDWGYVLSIRLNRAINRWRRRLGLGDWSLSAYLKRSVKTAVQFIDNYETTVQAECRKRGFDGVVCGHVHNPEMKLIGDIAYCNTGDGVESCTAIVEHFDGRLELLCYRNGDLSHLAELCF